MITKWAADGGLLTRIWDSAVCDQFSEKDSKTPDVRLYAEPAVIGRLGRGPLDGKPEIGFMFSFCPDCYCITDGGYAWAYLMNQVILKQFL